jgi:hypothetical protein
MKCRPSHQLWIESTPQKKAPHDFLPARLEFTWNPYSNSTIFACRVSPVLWRAVWFYCSLKGPGLISLLRLLEVALSQQLEVDHLRWREAWLTFNLWFSFRSGYGKPSTLVARHRRQKGFRFLRFLIRFRIREFRCGRLFLGLPRLSIWLGTRLICRRLFCRPSDYLEIIALHLIVSFELPPGSELPKKDLKPLILLFHLRVAFLTSL